jgi:MFS family permease
VNSKLVQVFSAIFFIFATQTMTGALVPLAGAKLNASGTLIGVLIAVPGMVGLVADIPAAAVSDSIGRRRPLMLGGVLVTAACVFFILGNSMAALVLGSVVLGLSASAAIGSALAYATELASPGAHARIQGYNGGVQGVSAVVGAILTGMLLQLTSFRFTFAVVGLLGGLIALSVIRMANTPPPSARALAWSTVVRRYGQVIELLKRERNLQLAALLALNSSFVFLVIGNSILPVVITKYLHFPVFMVGTLLGVRNLVAAVVSFAFGGFVARIGLWRTTVITNVLSVAPLLVMAGIVTPVAMYLLLALQGVGYGCTAATINLLVTSATPSRDRALGFSVVSVATRMGVLTLPVGLGMTLEDFGARPTLVTAGLVCTACVVCIALVSAPRRRTIDSIVAPAPVGHRS